MGMKPDSTDNVRKNQKMPKEMILYLLKESTASMINDKRTVKLTRGLISKKVFEIGKS
jgi:hypothetical protein